MNKEERKARIAEYSMAKRPAGVYRLVHVDSGKSYVGSTVDTDAMKNRLEFELNMGFSMKKALLADWRTYGAEAFRYEVLERFEPPEHGTYNLMKELESMEAKWLEKLQPYGEFGYNVKPKR